MTTVEAVETIHYVVDMQQNDRVDIRCGGPHFLGFDFYVDSETPTEEVEAFIREELEKNDKPCLSVRTSGTRLVRPEQAWTMAMIADCIKAYQL